MVSTEALRHIEADLDEPWRDPWPEDELEGVGCCPVCGVVEKSLLYDDLIDNVFRAAPGKWQLYQCQGCQSAYLDPRPTLATIGLAYQNYYTHNAALKRELPDALSGFKRFRRALANGYTNSRYGTSYDPAFRLGTIFAQVLSSQRERLDRQFRWLPKPIAGQRLLDVGCGNGAFLLKAFEAGWQTTGVDPDPNAVEKAQSQGLDVHLGSLAHFDGQAELFDAVTLSHVIEHTHDPKASLAEVFRLLKPGGTLYIDTPNIQSRGFSTFGKNWRGIETPRHLVLLSIPGIRNLLLRSGFRNINFKHRRLVSRGMFLGSLRVSLGFSPYANKPKKMPFMLSLKSCVLRTPCPRLEFITLIARK